MKLYTIVTDDNDWYSENKKPFISNDLDIVKNKAKELGGHVEIVDVDYSLEDYNRSFYAIYLNQETDTHYGDCFLDNDNCNFIFVTDNFMVAESRAIEYSESLAEVVRFNIVTEKPQISKPAKDNKKPVKQNQPVVKQNKEENKMSIKNSKAALVLDTAKVEAINGWWQSTTEKAIDIVCSQALKALKKATKNEIIFEYTKLCLEAKLGKAALAFVAGNVILVFYNSDPKIARLGEEIRTYGWRNCFSFLYDSVVEPIMGELKKLVESIPDVK